MHTRPTQARAHRSGIWHLLDLTVEEHVTLCGKDASLMARFDPRDLPSGERSHRTCEPCRDARARSCICGARDFPSCLCGLSLQEWARAHPDRPVR
jgi:hypothetical protein